MILAFGASYKLVSAIVSGGLKVPGIRRFESAVAWAV
jgi:hypothetical protein